jgi:hypothetical protein
MLGLVGLRGHQDPIPSVLRPCLVRRRRLLPIIGILLAPTHRLHPPGTAGKAPAGYGP